MPLHTEHSTSTTITQRETYPSDIELTEKLDVEEISPIPTIDDETGCATQTERPSQLSETFLDEISLSTAAKISISQKALSPRRNRDSHELILSPRRITHASLVDHMLLSFDHFKSNPLPSAHNNHNSRRTLTEDEERLYSVFADKDAYNSSENFGTWSSRRAWYQPNYSTDVEEIQETSNGGRLNRPRRSISSSNVRSVAGMIIGQNSNISHSARNQAPMSSFSSSHTYTHTRTTSRASSVDLTSNIKTSEKPGMARGFIGRASSFDYSSDYRTFQHRPKNWNTPHEPLSMQSVFNTSPRKQRMALATDISSPERRSTNKLVRKKSLRSTKVTSKGGVINSWNGQLGALPISRGDHAKEQIYPARPPLPTNTNELQQINGYNKNESSSSVVTSRPLPTENSTVTQTKERPGFFRRVFGTSRNTSANNEIHRQKSPVLQTHPSEPWLPHGSSSSVDTINDRSDLQPPFLHSHLKSIPARETSVSPPLPLPTSLTTSPQLVSSESMAVLNKKSSIFFRRRKKPIIRSASTVPVPPVPVMQYELPAKGPSVDKMLPNPPSSLQTVLHPNLRTHHSPIDIFNTHEFDDQWKDVTIATTDTTNKPETDSYPLKSSRITRTIDKDAINITNPSYNSASHMQLISNEYGNSSERRNEERDTTFLHDNSDTERDIFIARSTFVNPLMAHPLEDWSNNSIPVQVPNPLLSLSTIKNTQEGESDEYLWSRSSPLIPRQQMPETASFIRRTHIARQQSEDWVKITQNKDAKTEEKEDRVWLEPSSDEEEHAACNWGAPEAMAIGWRLESSESNSSTDGSLASLPVARAVENVLRKKSTVNQARVVTSVAPRVISLPTDLAIATGPRELESARRIYDGTEDLVSKERAAAWLAEEQPPRPQVLTAYMQFYNFTNLDILSALRLLCGRLVLKGESQQVDRILVAFAWRWCKCNPNHGFKSADVVHTISYSLLLLNTDLHLADIEQKMTRSQFLKNALPTLRKIAEDTFQETDEVMQSTKILSKSTIVDQDPLPLDIRAETKASSEVEKSSVAANFKHQNSRGDSDAVGEIEIPTEDIGPLIKAPCRGLLRNWEGQVEIVLKNFYTSIRNERLPLYGALSEKSATAGVSSNLSIFANGVLRRTPSVLSHAPSETQSYRSRAADTLRAGNSKWANKNRSRPRLNLAGPGLGSSRTSLDDQSSMWSPSVSSTWSKYSLGKTQTSLSVDSLGSSWPAADYQQSIGFANALSQAIIREEAVGATENLKDHENLREMPLLEDESLGLYGAPWAKEGIVKHKHHLESLDKKARERNWNEVFAVVEKGYLSMFSFSTKSMRHKTKGKSTSRVVGGGNWQENAQSVGSFLLQQTIASALPSPGYSKARPHVWALSLPTGAVHLFQVGTPDILREFVSTANYWSARLSNHPLVGGISNIEYGWSDGIIQQVQAVTGNSTPETIAHLNRPPTTTNQNNTTNTSSGHRPSLSGRSSFQGSMRTSLDQGTSTVNGRNRHVGDKISITDWIPPTQNMRASSLMEQDQLRTLINYVTGIEEELQKHNKLRSPMQMAFSPRHPNAQKAMANWEKKSAYLLREIVKFRTYIDCLQAAESSKQRIYAEREERKRETSSANEVEKSFDFGIETIDNARNDN